MSSILDQIKPETAQMIAAEARARGLSVEDYLKSLLPETNGEAEKPLYETATPEELAQAYVDWAESHDRSTPPLSLEDIGRESIYEGR